MPSLLRKGGVNEVSFEGDWRQIVEDARCVPLVLPTSDTLERTARQIACRPFSPSPVPSRVWLDTTWEVVRRARSVLPLQLWRRPNRKK